jgi:uncharacterized protein (DUF1697 family)
MPHGYIFLYPVDQATPDSTEVFMEKYLALLRGINVGGNNTIPMPALKAAFTNAGFTDVSTYINSGNVLFSAQETEISALQQQCRQAIIGAFQLDITVAVISAADLQEALVHAPAWWGNDPLSKHNAIFVIAPAETESLLAMVGAAKPEYEQLAYHGQVIFWSAPIATFSRTRWSKVVGTSAYGSITIRNANTAKKLAKLSE